MNDEIAQAMWDGDQERLNAIARCICCCDEHTFSDCPARVWSGCLGNGTIDPSRNVADWAKHYGMTPAEFLGG